jgi:CubicO group peptidase (beta-lactamase class C family)
MSVHLRAEHLASEYHTVAPGDLKASEFQAKIQDLATEALRDTPQDRNISFRASILAHRDFSALFTPGQISILRSSSNPLVQETARCLAIQDCMDSSFPVNIPGGCTAVIMREGEILFSHSVGDHSIDSPQHFGSVSKQFTAACIIDLVQKGKLRLDQDIRDILPLPVFTYHGAEKKITVSDLLHMQSGLPNSVDIARIRGKDDQDLSQTEAIAFLDPSRPFELFTGPGTEFNYCNTNYYLLAEIVKACSGEDLHSYANEHLFDPFGMASTSFVDPSKDSIPGYTERGEEVTTRNKTWGPCGVIGTARDMVAWDKECPKTTLWSGLTEAPEGAPYAGGLFVRDGDKYREIAHAGAINGFRTFYRRFESKGEAPSFSLFLAMNREADISFLSDMIVNAYLGQELLSGPEGEPQAPPVLEYNAEKMALREGIYSCSQVETKCELRIIEDQGNKVLELIPQGSAYGIDIFAPEVGNPQEYKSASGSPIELSFNEQGFIYIHPQGALKLTFRKE